MIPTRILEHLNRWAVRQLAGRRYTNGDDPGHLARCYLCGGNGLLFMADSPRPTPEPNDSNDEPDTPEFPCVAWYAGVAHEPHVWPPHHPQRQPTKPTYHCPGLVEEAPPIAVGTRWTDGMSPTEPKPMTAHTGCPLWHQGKAHSQHRWIPHGDTQPVNCLGVDQ